jgi:hypothetical protein
MKNSVKSSSKEVGEIVSGNATENTKKTIIWNSRNSKSSTSNGRKNIRYSNMLVTYMSYILEMKRLDSLLKSAHSNGITEAEIQEIYVPQYTDFMKTFYPFWCRQKVIIGKQLGENGLWEFKKTSNDLFRSLQSSYNTHLNDFQIQSLFMCLKTVSLLSIGESLISLREKYERNIIF